LSIILTNTLIISIFLGFIISLILDRIWFSVDYKKIEKGFEILEHYHFGITLMGVGFIIPIHIISYFIIGLGAGFIYMETKHTHCFAYQSGHFTKSSIIGIILCIVFILSVHLLTNIL